LPDIIGYLQKETELTRATLVRILIESGRLSNFIADPQGFMILALHHIKKTLHRLLAEGIQYTMIDGEYRMELLNAIEFEKRDNTTRFIMIPPKFKVETPIGTFNPNWAIVATDEKMVYMVRGKRDFTAKLTKEKKEESTTDYADEH